MSLVASPSPVEAYCPLRGLQDGTSYSAQAQLCAISGELLGGLVNQEVTSHLPGLPAYRTIADMLPHRTPFSLPLSERIGCPISPRSRDTLH